MTPRVLILGASGFLGSHLFMEFVGAGYDVIAVGRGYGDLLDGAAAERLVRDSFADVVILAAADPDRSRDARMTTAVAEACAAASARLVYLSCAEALAPMPTPRGVAKGWGETIVRARATTAQVVRVGAVYGPGGSSDVDWIVAAACDHEAMDEPWQVKAGSVAAWLYVADVTAAIRRIVERGAEWQRGAPSSRGTYAVCGLDEFTLTTVARVTAEVLGVDQRDWTLVPGGTRVPTLDSDDVRALGWAPTTPLRQGVLWCADVHRRGR